MTSHPEGLSGRGWPLPLPDPGIMLSAHAMHDHSHLLLATLGVQVATCRCPFFTCLFDKYLNKTE